MNDIASEVTKACTVLADERQALWTTLRLSTQQKLDYWLMLLHPSQVQAAEERMDTILWKMLESVVGAHLPRQQEGVFVLHFTDPSFSGPTSSREDGHHPVEIPGVSSRAHLPRHQEGLGYEQCLDIPVQNLAGKSF